MEPTQVLVVGAGPTGLVLALCLARQGVPVRIIDKRDGPGQASRAMAVHARTLEFYQQLGFADEVVAAGIKADKIHVRAEGDEAACVRFKDLGDGLSPFPFMLCYPQDDHERLLVDKLQAAGVSVDWGVELIQLTQDDTAVRAVLRRGTATNMCEVAYLCGGDGAHSAVRHQLDIDFVGGTYNQVFFVADVQTDGEPSHDIFVNFESNGLALMLPVRSSGMQRLIGVVPAELSERTDLTFDDFKPVIEHRVGVRVEQVNWFSTYHVHHRVAAHFRVGRCFIAGDAGHIHSPVGGQGMNTGIGDAVNLSWKLAQVIQGRAAASLLDTYEPERIAFAQKLVATTDRAFQFIIGRDRSGQFLRTWLLPHLASFLTGFSATRRLIFNTISQVRINYHGSALSEGKAGDVEGGDRLPWVPSAQGGNFVPLRSLDWQLHVYGDVDAPFADTAKRLGLPIQRFDWSEEAAHAGLQRHAAYLVRPDGYVALALPHQERHTLERFVQTHGLRFVGV